MHDAERLMTRVRARDERAFELLYDEYHRLVYGVALRVLGSVGGAEDVTQSVFLKLWSSPNAFRTGNFGAWIARVARNRALDALRGRPRTDGEVLETIPESDALEDAVFARMDATALRSALQQLPAEQREPIEQGFFGGITHEEMAKSSGIPLGTIKTRIRSGLHKLRAALDQTVTA